MKVNGKHYRTIWVKDQYTVQTFDQRQLPHEIIIEDLKGVDDCARAIKEMHVRGAPLIGATAAYGMYFAGLESLAYKSEVRIEEAANQLIRTRPTAIDLIWAVQTQLNEMKKADSLEDKTKIALDTANKICDESAEMCRQIGNHGSRIIEECSEKKNHDTVHILTHCNAGWLACVDYGTATAPIYQAFDKGIKVHVWVDETRPWNQGARLTAWELGQQGVPYTVIVDNAGGHLMQRGMVDMVIVGSDRTTYTGDVANKIGTYLKALAAKDNQVPFYVALPSSSIDWSIEDGVQDIPIEQRGDEEVKYAGGFCEGQIRNVRLTPLDAKSANYAFDVTPRRLVTGLITERGICKANKESILELYPEKKTL